MPEYLDDPSVLTKDKLKSELLAHNVELPGGNPTKDVYVQLYLKKLTAQKKKEAPDVFSSDEELPPPVVSGRSRSSGRKATRKTDKVRPDELDVTALTDGGLRDELVKHGVDVGPIVATTRKLYEKKLQKLMDEPAQPPPPQLVLTEIQVNHNGTSESDPYSDKEDEVTTEPEPEPVAEPEPAPVVERAVRSRGKTPVSSRSSSGQHHPRDRPVDDEHEEPDLRVKRRSRRLSHRMDPEPLVGLVGEPVKPGFRNPGGSASSRVDPVTFSPMCNISPIKSQESLPPKTSRVSAARLQLHSHVEKIAAGDQTSKVDENDVLKELFPNDINSPTGISATCRRPIRGAAGRPVKSRDLWNNENGVFSPKATRSSSSSSTYTESVNRVNSLPPSTPSASFTSTTSTSSSSSSRLLSAAPPATPTRAQRRSVSLWIKLVLLVVVAAFLFLVYQAMETNAIAPFGDSEASSESAA